MHCQSIPSYARFTTVLTKGSIRNKLVNFMHARANKYKLNAVFLFFVNAVKTIEFVCIMKKIQHILFLSSDACLVSFTVFRVYNVIVYLLA